jgi:hypothetical protein
MPADLVGEWSGTFRSWQRTVPMRLVATRGGDIFVWAGESPRAVLNEVSITNGRLNGRFAGRMPTDDAGRWPHDLGIGLVLEGGSLRGQVNAMSLTDPIMYSLSGYADLKRKGSPVSP